ncbi:hemerythrin domain-containing protein [Actinoallomurus spadix]|uniref:Hemerythrin-like domain-containing protein n=1 Tax=Actinoallomurus spadix TaxID=79912 RepID=A0ABN0W3F1_9ACTN|nr:hemerythrin domain-containing protein [Actinoallomurus spadix]MCO5985545.1 hemerythrin domain-containing protein [Actinoallomurus spadix]
MHPPDDLVSVLIQDHRDLQQLHFELGYTIEFPRLRHSLVELLIAEVVRHEVAEETYVFPVVRARLPHGPALVDEDVAGHREIWQVLNSLDEPDLTSEEFASRLSRLKATTAPHTRAEEEELYPALTEHLDEDERVALGRAALRAKEKAALRRYLAEPDCSLRNRVCSSPTTLAERVRTYLRADAYRL